MNSKEKKKEKFRVLISLLMNRTLTTTFVNNLKPRK
jgi:hypothetical protein